MNKIEALKYLIENEVYRDEWSGAGMYHALRKVVNSDNEVFTKEYLDKLLKEAEEF